MAKRFLISALTTTALLALVPAAQAGSNTALTLGSHPADATFATGQPDAPDNTILVRLEKLINNATDGSEIAITAYRMTDDGRIEEALKNARKDGVRVYVVRDPSDSENGLGDWLVPPSLQRTCDHGCLSRLNSTAIMHAKFALFSSTRRTDTAAPAKATWVSSANLNASSGTEAFNDAITWYGDTEMYTRLAKVFNDMLWGPVVDYDYFRPELEEGAGDWIAEDAVTVANVSPERQTNIWYSRLAQVKAPNEGGGPCTVRVMHANFGDGLLEPFATDGNSLHTPAYELRDLKARGCSVAVLVHHDPSHTEAIDTNTKRILCDAGISVRTHLKIHNKLVLTSSGLWYGPASQNYPQVMTGSHNLSINALRYNDELLVRIYGSQALYNAYNSHFLQAWGESDGACSWNGGT